MYVIRRKGVSVRGVGRERWVVNSGRKRRDEAGGWTGKELRDLSGDGADHRER
jgi:hypothetical protein